MKPRSPSRPRFRRGFAVAAILMHASLWSAAAEPAAKRVTVDGIRLGLRAGVTRVVIDSDSALRCAWFTLAGKRKRLVVDCPRLQWALDDRRYSSGNGAGRGLIAGYRYAQFDKNTSRLVFDLKGPARVSRQFTMPARSDRRGNRLVFDLAPVDEARFRADAARGRTRPARMTRPPGHETRRPIVVVDPGHGGRDPGASGVRGSREKDINLAAARELAKALRLRGRYRVEMTRTDDTYLGLEERVEKARAFEADLFISLHADAGSGAKLHGASIYTLSANGAARAERMRVGQDWLLPVERDGERSSAVTGILVDLVRSETKGQSARFARILLPALKAADWPLLRRSHRNAGFFVLLAPDVPAVLLEMGFLTNADDERRLTSPALRRPLIEATVTAIDAFFGERGLYLARQ